MAATEGDPHKAHWGLLLARTDWDQPKHRGLSYFILDMKQPGVSVQPLRQMNGYASFNQVFFTDVKVEPECLVSNRNGISRSVPSVLLPRVGVAVLWPISSAAVEPLRAEGVLYECIR